MDTETKQQYWTEVSYLDTSITFIQQVVQTSQFREFYGDVKSTPTQSFGFERLMLII